MTKKIILFGGTFDPVHSGHIEVAQTAAQKIGADKVILVPAKRSPHKGHIPNASGRDRIKMLELATIGKKLFEINDCELMRNEPSYTLDTVKYFKEKFGTDCVFYWLIGADTVKDLTKWHKINDLLDECRLAVMYRGGFDKPDFGNIADYIGKERVKRLSADVIATPMIDISSTEIRKKITEGKSTEALICKSVADYIAEKKLYR